MRRQSNNSIYNALISSRGRTLRLPALGLKIWVFETLPCGFSAESRTLSPSKLIQQKSLIQPSHQQKVVLGRNQACPDPTEQLQAQQAVPPSDFALVRATTNPCWSSWKCGSISRLHNPSVHRGIDPATLLGLPSHSDHHL